MDKDKIAEYKKKLEAERILLMKEISNDEKPVDFGHDVDHFDEETDEAEEMSNHLAAAQDLKSRLDEVDAALSNIASGNFGICEKCGARIGDDVLAVDPESRLCKNCKLAE